MTNNTKRYGAIIVDPPWRFIGWGDANENFRGPERHYGTMTFDDLLALPVGDYAAGDCVLFMWATDPLLLQALDLIKAWGFEYKTVGFYWVKLNGTGADKYAYSLGLGYWTRANPEMCLLATRGNPKRLSKGIPRLLLAPRREHSRKPDEIRTLIQQLVGGPYLELFARETAPGWDAWGDEVGKLDEYDLLEDSYNESLNAGRSPR